MRIRRNSLLIKELREEVRSRKIFFLVPVYIAILATISMIAVSSSSGLSFNPSQLASTSRYTMYAFVIANSILLGLIAIVLGAASFTTEREKATYELLELTPLTYAELVLGKFLHSFILVALILLSSLPVLSTLFFMGGLSYVDFVLTFFYLIVFFAVVILAAIAISIVSTRTIQSIILGLGLAFATSVVLGIVSTSAFREPDDVGFATLSPWLVIWRQIFSPIPLKILHIEVPVWPVYLILYTLLALLLLSAARNALDTRKLERNRNTRLLALLFLNAYVAIGILCMDSYRPVVVKDVDNLFQAIFIVVAVTLPLFALGTMTDKDREEFESRPLLESIHPTKVFLNYPVTGVSFLVVLLLTISLTIALSAGLPVMDVLSYPGLLVVWVLPWMLLFISMRLLRMRPRAMFVAYVLAALVHVLAAAFYHAKTTSNSYDFFLADPLVAAFYVIAISLFLVAWFGNRRRRRLASTARTGLT